MEDFLEEGNFRYTVYRVKHKPAPGKDSDGNFPINTKLEFLEYLNNDEVDQWMHSNAHKYPSVIVARSDNKWVMYDQPHGASFKKVDFGKNFNTVFRGVYNKKADVSEGTVLSFKEYLNEASDNDTQFEQLIKKAKSLPLEHKSASEVLKDKAYIKGKIGDSFVTFSYMLPSDASGAGYRFIGLSVNDAGKVINTHNTTFKKMASGELKSDSSRKKNYLENVKEFKDAIQSIEDKLKLTESKYDVSDIQKAIKAAGYKAVTSGGLKMITTIYRGNQKIGTVSEDGVVKSSNKEVKSKIETELRKI